ncbi:Protein NSP-interacting kinase 3 [Senna tora]|uniref:Protein NSP-interacting kinase 3 n=1 Tax=Senna tora TaxID=362788 RepID=A0A834W9Z0_9FABA|nr:Protein NSP-interacting kinase 3 [Senna tora]
MALKNQTQMLKRPKSPQLGPTHMSEQSYKPTRNSHGIHGDCSKLIEIKPANLRSQGSQNFRLEVWFILKKLLPPLAHSSRFPSNSPFPSFFHGGKAGLMGH